jgi:hypothetical protein
LGDVPGPPGRDAHADGSPEPPTTPHTEAIAAALTEGVRALRAGRAAEAVPLLLRVCDDPELAAAADLRDVRARALSLCAEALFLAGRGAEALGRAGAALAAARRLGDIEGIQEIEQLQLRIAAAAPSEDPAPRPSERERETLRRSGLDGVDQLYAGAPPELRADWLLRRATVAAEDRDADLAIAAAERALAEGAAVPRVGVLARTLLARLAPDRAPLLLQQALDSARDAGEHTLVGAVVRAAALAGIALDGER